MSALLSRIHRGLIFFNGSLAGLAMMLIFLLVAGNAFARYTYGGSISWGEDTAIYLMIYGPIYKISISDSTLSAVYCLRTGCVGKRSLLT